MYSKNEAARLKESFWTTFGKYMAPVNGADGFKVNWINYKTGVKHIFIRMDADNGMATIGIEVAHKDTGLQELYFNEFLPFKTLLETISNDKWDWAPLVTVAGTTVSRIFISLKEVSIFNTADWPALISFFKQHIIALDEFWSGVKYHFEGL